MEHHNKKHFLLSLLLLPALFLALQACYYDNEEYLYADSANCATENMSYSQDVKPVINASCIGCHGGANPSGNISLETYNQVAAAASIQPGNYGSLYGAISHASGNSPMPKNSNMLSACTLAKIKAWIEQGAMDN